MTTISTPRRLVVALFGCALVLAACGDDSDDGADATPGSGDGVTTAATSVAPEADAPSGDVGAVVVIGDEEYAFTDEDTCLGTATAMTARFKDGTDVKLNVDLPPFDWETSDGGWGPPELELTDSGDDLRRSYLSTPTVGEQFPETEAGRAVITAYELGDGWATGSGHVIDVQALANAQADEGEPPSPVAVTFEIVCSP